MRSSEMNRFERAEEMTNKALMIVLAAAVVLAVGSHALAGTVVSLTDGDSTVEIDPGSSAGMSKWDIGDTSYLAQQWFWIRTNVAGVYDDHEYSFDQISAPVVAQPDSDVATITYGNDDIEAQVTYLLTDEPGPTGGSDILEILLITNKTDQTMMLNLFQYSDFELGGDANDTKVEILNGNTAKQHDIQVAALLSETIVSGAPGLSEVDDDGSTLAKLTDGDIDDLDGPTSLTKLGDLTWAFQWQAEIASGQALLLSKSKHLSIASGGGDDKVPEPAGLGLIGLALMGLRKRRK
jgi:hypothetical protein